jgi:hypothetical protein
MWTNSDYSKFMRLDMMVDRCNNKTRANKNCKSEDEISMLLPSLTVKLY